jgi:hypothetical protein
MAVLVDLISNEPIGRIVDEKVKEIPVWVKSPRPFEKFAYTGEQGDPSQYQTPSGTIAHRVDGIVLVEELRSPKDLLDHLADFDDQLRERTAARRREGHPDPDE